MGCELSAHLALLRPELDMQITLMHSGSRLIGDPYSEDFSNEVLQALHALNITVRCNARPTVVYAKGTETDLWAEGMARGFLAGDLQVQEEGKEVCSAELVFFCTGAASQASSLRAFPLTSAGRVRVGPSFQVEGRPNAFAIGDCCDMEQMFWHAPKHALVAAHNIGVLCRAKASPPPLRRYRPDAAPPLGLRLSAHGPLVCSHDEAATDPLEHALR